MPRVKVPVQPQPSAAPRPIQQVQPVAVPVQQPAPHSVVAQESKRYTRSLNLLIGGAVLLLIVILAIFFSLLQQRNHLQDQVNKLQNPQTSAKSDVKALVAQVGKYIDLPTGEDPTLITVSDVVKAKQQSSFFENAENGDKVLLYAKAKEAILWRPSTSKIIKVAPISSGASGTTSGTSTTATP